MIGAVVGHDLASPRLEQQAKDSWRGTSPGIQEQDKVLWLDVPRAVRKGFRSQSPAIFIPDGPHMGWKHWAGHS